MRKHSFISFAILPFTLCLLTFISCNSDSKKEAAILQSVENIVKQNPDSALVLLNSIENPYEMDRELHQKYVELLIESEYKTDEDISNDTMIFRQKTGYLDIQKRYDFESLQQANAKLLIDRENFLVLFLLVILVLIVVAFMFYRKKVIDDKIISHAKEEIYQLNEIINASAKTGKVASGNRKDAANMDKDAKKNQHCSF
jgi:hypothetical protein